MPRKKKIIVEEGAAEEEINDDPIINGNDVEMEHGQYPRLSRCRTGLFSLDLALSQGGDLGLPLRVIVELYGYTNSGKSTLGYFLSGAVSKQDKKSIMDADLEMLDLDYVKLATAASGFKGKIQVPDLTDDKGVLLPHEKVLMTMAKSLLKEETGAIIWDSVGATQAMAELDVIKDPKAMFGEAFMGKRAKLVGQVALALRNALMAKKTPSTAIAINHVHGNMGGKGHTTPGGERLKYLAGVRLMIYTQETFYVKEDDPDSEPIGFLVHGQVEKLRFGGRGREFTYYIVPGFGVHPGASAMFDCISFGIAKREARVTLDGKSLGYLKADLLSYAAQGKSRKFDVFQDRIAEYSKKVERGDI